MNDSKTLAVRAGHIHCPECNSSQVRYRQQSNTYICRRCGQLFTAVKKRGNWEIKPIEVRG